MIEKIPRVTGVEKQKLKRDEEREIQLNYEAVNANVTVTKDGNAYKSIKVEKDVIKFSIRGEDAGHFDVKVANNCGDANASFDVILSGNFYFYLL